MTHWEKFLRQVSNDNGRGKIPCVSFVFERAIKFPNRQMFGFREAGPSIHFCLPENLPTRWLPAFETVV